MVLRGRRAGPLLARVLGAIFGGYGLAALSSVAVLALPVDRVQAVIAGMLLSFWVFCAAVIWVFAVRSARRAWLGLGVAALPLLCLAAAVWAGRAP